MGAGRGTNRRDEARPEGLGGVCMCVKSGVGVEWCGSGMVWSVRGRERYWERLIGRCRKRGGYPEDWYARVDWSECDARLVCLSGSDSLPF